MPMGYQACQAGHGTAAWLLKYGQEEWKNNTLIYLSIPNEEILNYWIFKLGKRGMKWAEWREPDMDNQLTCIACLTDTGIFSNLKLLK